MGLRKRNKTTYELRLKVLQTPSSGPTTVDEALLGVLGIRDNWLNNYRDKG